MFKSKTVNSHSYENSALFANKLISDFQNFRSYFCVFILFMNRLIRHDYRIGSTDYISLLSIFKLIEKNHEDVRNQSLADKLLIVYYL